MEHEDTFRIFVSREEGEWVALALDMDLRGYGDTVGQAIAELGEMIDSQLSFARYKGIPEMAWFDAEPIWWFQAGLDTPEPIVAH